MNQTTREKLCAYADGELPASERAAIEQLVRSDPAAAAEVAFCRSLRQACRRSLEGEAIPASLAIDVLSRIRAQQRVSRARLLRVGIPGLAAALLLLTVWLWPTSASAETPIAAAAFEEIYERCAVHGRHDSLGVRAVSEGTCSISDLRSKSPFACRLPNMASCGRYHMDGACTCSPSKSLRVVHVYFRSDIAPDVVVSAFTIERPIRLDYDAAAGDVVCASGNSPDAVSRPRGVAVVARRENDRSYVLVAKMPRSQLEQLAGTMSLASIDAMAQERGEALALYLPDSQP